MAAERGIIGGCDVSGSSKVTDLFTSAYRCGYAMPSASRPRTPWGRGTQRDNGRKKAC